MLLKGQALRGAENLSLREITKGLVRNAYRMSIFISTLQCFTCVCVCVCVCEQVVNSSGNIYCASTIAVLMKLWA